MKQSSGNSGKSHLLDNILRDAEKMREKSLYRESLRLFTKALRGYVKMNNTEGIIRCMLSLGDICRMVGDFTIAAESYLNAIAHAHDIGSPVHVADAQVGLGLSLRAQGKWREALQYIRKAKNMYKKKNDIEGLAFSTWAEAGALRIKGDIPETIRTFYSAYMLFKSLKDTRGTGYCLCGLGGASRIAGAPADSLKYYMAANRIFASVKDRFGKAYSYCGIGNAYRMRNDFHSAFAYFSKATRLYEKIGDRVSYAYTLWGLGTAYKMTGNYKKATGYLTMAMQLFRKTKDPRGIIYCKLGFGEIAFLNGKKALAKKYLSDAERESDRYKFSLEECYTETLLSFIHGGKDTACHTRLGLKLNFQRLPLNIP
jgi:tetratricopeptide (TPR) repeat protein